MLAIETVGLTRRFGAQQGVEDITLQVPAGSIYGFLGPNGAGKTTSMRLLLGLLKPDKGQVVLNGKVLDQNRQALQRVGSMIESPSLYPHLSGRDNLEVTRRLLGLPSAPIEKALQTVSLERDAHRKAGEYSLGMKQRLGIAQALLQEPDLLILDEPNNGLDPEGVVQMRELLKSLSRDHGISIMLSSHQLSEIEHIAEHIGIIVEGKLRYQGTVQSLLKQNQSRLRIECQPQVQALAVLAEKGLQANIVQGAVELECQTQEVADINRSLVEAGIAISALHPVAVTLESLFFSMTKSEMVVPET
jgi:ABC-type multidrug transport system ATPase subunit